MWKSGNVCRNVPAVIRSFVQESCPMMVNIPTLEWRVLRTVGRSKKPVPGSRLRLEMTRRTKDGSFLTWLVDMGLLVRSKKGGDPFESTYMLSELGKKAADYGQIDIPWEEIKELDLRVTKTVAAKKTPPPRVERRRGGVLL